jgi:rSAM/selenodomain-associated transferase 2
MKPLSVKRAPTNIFWGCVLGFLFLTLFMARLGPIGKTLFLFGTLYSVSFLVLVILFKTFPNEWSIRRQIALVFFLAILCRLFFLAYPASYDVNRYIWEGYIWNKGFNPYLYAPNHPILEPLVNDIWYNINHKEASACYPPLVTLLFGLCAAISPTPTFFKIVIMLFDVAAIPLLLLSAKSLRIQPSRVMFYALNPLIIVFFAGEGHVDAIQVFFVSLCLFSFIRNRERWGFLALGCAIMSKYFALIMLPFFINSKNWKKSFSVLIPLLSYLPFWETGPHLFSSLVPFGTIMHYNDSLTVIFRAIFGTNAVWTSVILLVICLGVIFIMVRDPLRSSYLAFGSLLILLATLHPWYLSLITPFLVFFPSRAWIYLHFAVMFTFPVLHVECLTGVFQEIHWLKLLEYPPFYALLIWEVIRPTRIASHPDFQPVISISVVIPTLNESRNIAGALESLKEEAGLLEKIVVDGGSRDDSRDKARSLGALVIEGTRGRGLQVKEGIERCHGDVILILHADCRIRAGSLRHILERLNENPQFIGGALGMRYDSERFKDRLLAWLNNSRARWTGISFGDQCQFFRKEALAIIGGYPEQMLMEDVELSLRLKENGLLCYIPDRVVVSKRRWVKMGFWRNSRRVVALCLRYLIESRLRLGDSKRKDFYYRYYGD